MAANYWKKDPKTGKWVQDEKMVQISQKNAAKKSTPAAPAMSPEEEAAAWQDYVLNLPANLAVRDLPNTFATVGKIDAYTADNIYKMGGASALRSDRGLYGYKQANRDLPQYIAGLQSGTPYGMTEEDEFALKTAASDVYKHTKAQDTLLTARTGGLSSIDMTGMPKAQQHELQRGDTLARRDAIYEKLKANPDQEYYEHNYGEIFGDMSEREYLDNFTAYLRDQQRKNAPQAKHDALKAQSDAAIAEAKKIPGYEMLNKYIPEEEYLYPDMTYLEGVGTYTTQDGQDISASEYRNNSADAFLAAFVDAGSDEKKRRQIEFAIELLPELNNYNIEAIPYMSDDQRGAFFAMWNSGDRDGAKQLLKNLDEGLQKERVETETEQLQAELEGANWAEKALYSASTVPMNLYNELVGGTQMLAGIFNPEGLEGLHEYSAVYDAGRDTQTVRGEVGQDIADATENIRIPGTDINIPRMAYNALMSGADSVTNAFLLGAAGAWAPTIAMGAGAFGTEYRDSQNYWDALAAGAIEAGTEYLPFENMGRNAVNPFKKIGAGMLAEGLGESAAEIGNIVYDTVKYTKNSEAQQYIDELITMGYTPEEALGETVKKYGLEVLEAGLTGATSGGGSASTTAISDSIKNRTAGNNITDNGGEDALASLAESVPVDDKAKDIARRLREEMAERRKGDKAETETEDAASITAEDAEAEARESEMAARDSAEASELDKGDKTDEGIDDTADVTKEDAEAEARETEMAARDSAERMDDSKGEKADEAIDDTADVTKEDADAAVRAEEMTERDRAERADEGKTTEETDAAAVTEEDAKAAVRTARDRGESADMTRGGRAEAEIDDTASVTEEDVRALTEAEAREWLNDEASWAESDEATDTDAAAKDVAEEPSTINADAIASDYADTAAKRGEIEAREAERQQRKNERKAARDKGRKAVTKAEKGYLYRQILANLDKGAQQIVKDNFSRDMRREIEAVGYTGNAKEAAKVLSDFINGEVTPRALELLDGFESLRNIALSYMGKIEMRNNLYKQAGELSERAQKGYVKSETTAPEEDADKAEGLSEGDAEADGDIDYEGMDADGEDVGGIEVSDTPESTYDGKAVTIESVKTIPKMRGEYEYRVTVKDADGNTYEVSAADVSFGSNDGKMAEIMTKALELKTDVDTAISMFNPETQDVSEYIAAWNAASEYGFDGRSIDVVKGDASINSVLTPEQIEAAYNSDRDFRRDMTGGGGRFSAYRMRRYASVPTGKVDTSAINMRNLKPNQKAAIRAMSSVAKAVGFNLRFVESVADADGKYRTENGSWDPATLTLTLDIHAGSNNAADINYAMMHTAGHELTHFIKQFADGDLWNDYHEFVIGHLSKKGDAFDLDGAIKKHMDRGLSRDIALEEVIADASGEALMNITEADIQSIAETNPTLLDKIKNFFKKWISNLKKRIADAYADTEAKTEEAKQMQDVVDEMSKRWNELFVNATKNKAVASETTIEGVEMSESGDTAYAGTDLLYDLRTFNESDYVTERDKAAAALAKKMGITTEKAEAYIDDVTSIAAMVARDRDRLDFESEDEYTALKHNSEYKFTVDFSTLCKKRLLYTGTFDAIQKQMPDTALTEDDYIRLRQMMADRGYEVACAFCYVESRRKNNGEIINKFLEVYKNAQKSGGQMELGPSNRRKAFKVEEGFTPSIADFNTSEGIANIMHNHRGVYDAYMYFMNARGVSKPKLIESRTAYNSEILKKFRSASAVRAMNKRGGLSLQSFSDFEVVNMLDMMQVVMDMSRVGLMSQAYTKVPAFARVFGATGVKINLSLVTKGVDKNGKLIFDDVEGMPHEEAFKIRDMYSENVGTILVGKDDATIRAAMADPRIDFIIPYHASGWSTENQIALGIGGYTNFTAGQNETNAATGKTVKNFQPSEYWDFSKTGDENAQTYIKMCMESGRIPKFPQYQNFPGYWKMLIDFKMYDNDGNGSPQRAVRPDFNLSEAQRIMNDYTGGHQNLPVARDVVRDFVKGKKSEKSDIKYSPRDFEQAEKTAEEGFESWCKKVENLTETEYRELKESTPLIMVSKDTPKILQKYGAKDLKMLIRLDALYLAIRREGVQEGNYHSLGAENMRAMIDQLDDPDAILLTDDKRLKALVRVNTKKGQAMASIQLDTTKDYEGKNEAVNLIITAFDYERRYLRGQFTKYGAKVLHKKEALSQVNPQLHEWLETFNESASGERIAQNEPVVKSQERDYSVLSDRELLVEALETDLKPVEREHLEKYAGKIDDLNRQQQELETLHTQIAEMRAEGKTATNSSEMLTALDKAKKLREKIDRADAKLKEIESADMIREVVRRTREETRRKTAEQVRARADDRMRKEVERVRGIGERKVKRVKDSYDTDKYRKQILADVRRIHGWIASPTSKGYAPEFMREPLAELIDSIDFTSARGLKGGDPTKADAKFTEALDKMREAVTRLNKAYAGLDEGAEAFSGYIDLPADFADEFDALVSKIKGVISLRSGISDAPFFKMSADQLHEMAKMFRILKSSIMNVNRLVANSRYDSAQAASTATIDDMNEMSARKKTHKALETLNSTFNWKNATPIAVFERLGRGGRAVFEGLQDGWDRMARNSRRVVEYAKSAFNGTEKKAWSSEITKVELDSGDTIQMTVAQKMSLYCLAKREQAQKHLMGGGIRIADIDGKRGTTISQTEDYILTEGDIARIIGSLTDRQREVADALQAFMNDVCAMWGNEISMKRFGFEQMTEKHYFPIETDANNRSRIDESKDGSSSMFRLLNMSSLKPLTPNANNAIVIKDIFNVFNDHASDMAKYNALALPILDFIKWYNYVEKTDVLDAAGNPTGKHKTRSVQKALERAYGKDAKSYLLSFIKDLNAEQDGGRNDNLINSIIGKAKSAAVGANLRVYGLQVTSLPRAAYAINPKYLAIGAARIRHGNSLRKDVGILQWKDLGFYSTDIARSMRGLVNRDDSLLGKIRNWQMVPAGWGDQVVSSIICEAVAAEMQDKYPSLATGSDAYKTVFNRRVREIIYKTQVVDSTMTRSEFMRSKGLMSTLTAFMSEPTLTFNMLNESVQKTVESLRKGESLRDALRNTGGLAVRAATTFAVTAFLTALMESAFDALRDDDEYETLLEKFNGAFTGNLIDNVNIFAMLPYIKDVLSIFQGYENSSLITQGWQQVQDFRTAIESWQNGKAPIYRVIYNGLKATSSMSGVGVGNATRDVVSLYNTFLAPAWDTPKLQTYADTESTAAEAYYGAVKESRTDDAEYYMQRMEVVDADMDKVSDKMVSMIGDDFVAGDITEANARKWLKDEAGLDADKINTKMRDWNFKAETGISYSEFKGAYAAGIIADAEAKRLLKKYRGYDDNKVYFTLLEWKGGEDWSRYDAFLDAVDAQSNFAAEARKLLDHGVNKSDIASEIAKAYKDAYREIHGTSEGDRMLEYLLDVYESIGYDRDYKRKYITKNWLKG